MNHSPNQLGKKIQNYIFNYSDFLGAGNFSKCYKGINQLTNEIVAIKIVQLNSLKSKKLQELLFQQIQILKKLNHPSVLRCYEIFTSNRNCYIITELCNEGNLQNKLKMKGVFDQHQANPLIRDVYNGLLYLAHNNIVHRDFKSANIFLNNGMAKIADFGFAKQINHNFKDFNIGSPLYMSPQGILHNVYGPKTQVWALGIFVYQLFHGTTPYSYCKTQEDLKRSVSMPLNWNQLKPDLAADIKQFILTCLQVNQQKRITIEQLGNLNYMRRINPPDNFLNKMQVRSPSKSSHFAINKMNEMIPIQHQRINNNFRPIQNHQAVRQSSQHKTNNNNKLLFMSVDKRGHIHNNSFSSPKRGLILNNNTTNNRNLGSPNRTMTINPNYINQNNKTLLNSIRQVENQQRNLRPTLNNNEESKKQFAYINSMTMTSPSNQNVIQYQTNRTSSYANNYPQPINKKNFSNNQPLDNLGINTFTGRFFGEPKQKIQSVPSLGLKRQSSKTLQNNIFVDKINFREAIFFIHHCRLLYKFLQIYKQSPWFDQSFYIRIYKYLLTVLGQLKLITEKDWILADGQKSSNKIKKLAEVNVQYFNKYKKKAEQYGYYIQPQYCPQTTLSYIKSLVNNLYINLNNQIYVVSRKNYLNPTDENLIILGHLAIIIKSSIQQIQKAIISRNYKLLSSFKQIEAVLNTSRQQFTCSSYRKYRQKFVAA